MLTIKKEFETTQFCLFSWYMCNGYNLYVGERWEMKPGRWTELDSQGLDEQLNSLDLRTRLREQI